MGDSRYDDEQWTPEEFIEKYDSEGGIGGMLAWGGAGCFPPELRNAAEKIDRQMNTIHEWLNNHGY